MVSLMVTMSLDDLMFGGEECLWEAACKQAGRIISDTKYKPVSITTNNEIVIEVEGYFEDD